MKATIVEFVFIAGASILGWIIGRKCKTIRLAEKNDSEDLDQTVLHEEELYYKEEELNNVPNELKELLDCSVDLCCLKSPVISPNGITFEKNSICEWLKRKNICPVTKQELRVKDLRFNRNLCNLINFLVLRNRYNHMNPGNEIQIKEILQ